jgi:hypothetical protein
MFDSVEEIVVPEEVKQRRCLNCTDQFPSVWAGERVCKRCKQTSSWRSGVASKPANNR